ncbi:methyl transferase [Thelonectria olida]|uniref:Methyl transferase n=1 Tax=Thelonectria olida TaxID=1576542 RepID=A0A9P8WJ60_9HYPO|nr:methyl transferase [Thelonectria olida]
MVVMASQNREAENEGRRFDQGFWRHGRFYGSWKIGKYLVPIDAEELNRLDILHKFFQLLRNEKPFESPIVRPNPKIMDLGTGTGIWAISITEGLSLAETNTHMLIMASIPPGCHPMQFDLEEPTWGPLLTDCDLIHIRMLLGSIRTDLWPQTYRNVLEHLAPGIGHLEQVEIDWTPRWDDDERPAKSVYQEWVDLYLNGMDQFNRTARVNPEKTRQMLEAAGFTDIKEQVRKVYLCPWTYDRDERELARWFNLGASHSLEAFTLIPLIDKLGMKFEDVRELCAAAKDEICKLRYHTYCNV